MSFQNSSRRQFLQGMAAAGASSALLPSVSAFAKESANDRPVFATIGLRNQGWAITNKSFKFADFAAMADVDENVLGENLEKAKEKQGKKPDGYGDYRKVLERDDIDAVMIATPDHWHTKIAVEAMYAGKDVYCEKPLTVTIDEGKLIEKVVKETGRVFQVGTMQRSESGQRFLQAIALIRAGRIGKVQKVTCGINGMTGSPVIPVAEVPQGLDWDFWLGPAPKVDYRALPEMRKGYGGGVPLYSNCHYSFRNWHEYSGGKLTDWGAHHVDIACWALGASDTGPSKVTPVEYKLPVEYKDGYPVVDDQYNAATSFRIRVDMPNDVEMIITSSGDNGILFEGTEGRFFVNRGKITGKPVEDLESNPLPEGAIEDVYGGPVSANHTANFIEGMRSREQPISDVWSHNRMLEICHLSNIAMRLGREVQWDAAKREIVGDSQANAFLGREYRKGYEIEM
ncbi:MAG: Gfo/Idh/MocA family protein [Rubinisphaera brasiliensis]|uniref:Oxidoreductase domain protein n=1 Tax=Rubinisphaera brasiliensis (strain ATCC 49424 / DSM 5305 / JCM 21570 / IAM 15109 / NBRC 103401 / IFAM 1448) TaxID=756272 RepID=F0SRS5_RUBBR|nr:Gfo/Idh/MocA family oxidoreductase [Rubinisphaera brasiliensis]ADY60241.1 oxidoreductase domain protein [Rubinisphaera brasiliensis DSM 5305]MBB03059.1 gfo/Idh/MocA family oxidoreductase [Planctomyces sp.]